MKPFSGVKSRLGIKIFGDDFTHSRKVWSAGITYSIHCAGGCGCPMEITSGVAELSVRRGPRGAGSLWMNVTDVEEAVAAGGSGVRICK